VSQTAETDLVLECGLLGGGLWENGGFARVDLEDWFAIGAGPS
jgi:hypothetical protein